MADIAKKRLIILSDYGLDDAAATVFLLNHRAKFDGVDIVAIGGNTDVKNSLNNAKKLLVAYAKDSGYNLNDVRLIDTCDEPQPFTELPSIHGNDGMGDLFKKNAPLGVELLKYNAWLLDLFNVLKNNKVILLSLGPCTLTRQIMDAAKENRLLPHIQLVLMAGMVNEQPNFEGREFNQALDVVAYEHCLKYKHVIATLDTCRAPTFNLAQKRQSEKVLLGRVVNKSEQLAEARHYDNCFIYDLIAAQFLVTPSLFVVEKVEDNWGNTLNQLKANEPWQLFPLDKTELKKQPVFDADNILYQQKEKKSTPVKLFVLTFVCFLLMVFWMGAVIFIPELHDAVFLTIAIIMGLVVVLIAIKWTYDAILALKCPIIILFDGNTLLLRERFSYRHVELQDVGSFTVHIKEDFSEYVSNGIGNMNMELNGNRLYYETEGRIMLVSIQNETLLGNKMLQALHSFKDSAKAE